VALIWISVIGNQRGNIAPAHPRSPAHWAFFRQLDAEQPNFRVAFTLNLSSAPRGVLLNVTPSDQRFRVKWQPWVYSLTTEFLQASTMQA